MQNEVFKISLFRFVDITEKEFDKLSSELTTLKEITNFPEYVFINEQDYQKLSNKDFIKEKFKNILIDLDNSNYKFYQLRRYFYFFKEDVIFSEIISYSNEINKYIGCYNFFTFISFNELRDLVLKNLINKDFLDNWDDDMYIYIKKTI